MKLTESSDNIYWFVQMQTIAVWIWKTASAEMGRAAERLFFLAGSLLIAGLNPLCLNAARLWKNLSLELWIDILHSLEAFVPVELYMLYTPALALLIFSNIWDTGSAVSAVDL